MSGTRKIRNVELTACHLRKHWQIVQSLYGRTKNTHHCQHYYSAVCGEAVTEHMTRLQKRFEEHWEGRTGPWEDAGLLDIEIKKSRIHAIL